MSGFVANPPPRASEEGMGSGGVNPAEDPAIRKRMLTAGITAVVGSAAGAIPSLLVSKMSGSIYHKVFFVSSFAANITIFVYGVLLLVLCIPIPRCPVTAGAADKLLWGGFALFLIAALLKVIAAVTTYMNG